jgi:hypothetical protein
MRHSRSLYPSHMTPCTCNSELEKSYSSIKSQLILAAEKTEMAANKHCGVAWIMSITALYWCTLYRTKIKWNNVLHKSGAEWGEWEEDSLLGAFRHNEALITVRSIHLELTPRSPLFNHCKCGLSAHREKSLRRSEFWFLKSYSLQSFFLSLLGQAS